MAVQLAVSTRNLMLNQIEIDIGPDAVLKVRTGPKPANVAAADTGDVLATCVLPTNWMNDAAAGQKTKAGTWQDLTADDTGIAGHFRIYKADGVTCMLQGSYGTSLSDMIGDSVNFTTGQTFTVNTFTLNAGNA